MLNAQRSGEFEAGTTQFLLSVRGLEKTFGRQVALHDVTFAIMPGQFVGLLGPNGAGKTTLALLLSGLMAPDKGEITLFGTSYRSARAAILSRLGVVFQSRSLDAEMSVRSSLKFHGALFGLSGGALDERIAEVAEVLDIAGLLARRVDSLSGGNLRRVEIARALLNRPLLVLLDEATTGLDAAVRQALLGHIRKLCRKGLTVLWATHLIDEVADADRLLVLDDGRLKGSGSAKDLLAETGASDLLSAYRLLTAKESAV